MPIDMRRPMIAAIQAALDEVQAEPPKKKRHGVGASRALLLGAGLYTAGRVVARGHGRGLIDAIEQRLPHQQDGSGDDEPEDDASDEDLYEDEDDEFDEDAPEDQADQEPEDEVDQESEDEAADDAPEPEEDEEEPAPKAEGDEAEPEDEAPEDVDKEPEDEAEPEAPKPKRGSRGRATRSRK